MYAAHMDMMDVV